MQFLVDLPYSRAFVQSLKLSQRSHSTSCIVLDLSTMAPKTMKRPAAAAAIKVEAKAPATAAPTAAAAAPAPALPAPTAAAALPAPTALAALPPPTAVLAAVAPTALASTALPTGAAAPSAPAVAAAAPADKGRPSSGVSRAAQSAFEHFKRSKKGAAALGGLSTEEQKDFRKRWLLEKEHALNAIHEKNVETLTSSTNQRTNWYTKMELAQQLGLTADQATALTSGLPRNPSRFAHLRQDREWDEYEYFIRQSDAKKENSSSMATSSKVDVEDEAVMNDISESLGVGQGFAVGNPMLEGPAFKKPRTKPAAKKAAAKPTGSAASVASGSGGPAPAGAPTQEDWESQTLDKLEASGQALLKSSREMLKQLPDFVAKKSHFTG